MLGAHAVSAQHEPGELVVRFADSVPVGLLEHTLEVERGCCAFLRIAYDPGDRRLTIATANVDQDTTLAALFSALTATAGRDPQDPRHGNHPSESPIAGSDPKTRCCEPTTLKSCCEPDAKDACCGTPAAVAPQQCGCST